MMIDSITELEQGSIIDAKVVKIEKSIVELELLNGRKGKMHISEVANQHVESIEDILKQGDTFKALIIDFEKVDVQNYQDVVLIKKQVNF